MTVLHTIFRLVFPERDTALMIRKADETQMLRSYRPQTYGGCISLSSYQNPLVRAAIREIKFHTNERAAALLSVLLKTWVTEHIHEPVLIVPMPLARSRLRTRGYNQVARVLAYAAHDTTFLSVADTLLTRTHNTKPQTSLDKKDRAKNVMNAFRIKSERAEGRIRDAHILLLDDVYTTGATMHAAKDALVPYHPASVTCIALAH